MIEEKIALSSEERLQELLDEAEAELLILQPEIEEIEAQMEALKALKIKKQRLLTLKMSLKTMLENITKDLVMPSASDSDALMTHYLTPKSIDFSTLSAQKTFSPDEALKQVEATLKQKQSLNYDMFKAVVFNGGKASTEQIKQYLVETGAVQPQTGEDFKEVPLTEISSRANYLVRKGVLHALERGVFYTALGWIDA